MADFVEIELTKKSREFIERFQDAPEILADAIREGLDRAGLLVISRIQRNRFTGKGPFPVSAQKLGVRTGRLRRSLGMIPARIKREKTMEVETEAGPINARAGSVVSYFAAHEFGSRRPVSVRAHRRQRQGQQPHDVRSHTRRMNVPERMPLRAGLRERKTQELFADAIEQAMTDRLENLT